MNNYFECRRFSDWIFDSISDRTNTSPTMVWDLLVRWAKATQSSVMVEAFTRESYEFDDDNPEDRCCKLIISELARKTWKDQAEFVSGLKDSIAKLTPFVSAYMASHFYMKALWLSLATSVVGASIWSLLALTFNRFEAVIPVVCTIMIAYPAVMKKVEELRWKKSVPGLFG